MKRAIDEFRGLIDEMDDIRAVLGAHGVPRRSIRMMVEIGIQKSPETLVTAIDSAMKRARKSVGDGCLKRADLENYIATMINLDRDLTHARQVARDEGLDTHALTVVTHMIQENPGDSGAKAANTLVSYIAACGIETDQAKEMLGDLMKKPASVLPQIPCMADKPVVNAKKLLVQDLLLGLGIGIVVIWALM